MSFNELVRHGRVTGHSFSRYRCNFCWKKFDKKEDLRDHQNEHYTELDFTVVDHAFDHSVEVLEKVYPDPQTAPKSIDELFERESDVLYSILKGYVVRLRFIAVYFVFTGKFLKRDGAGNTTEILMMPLRSSVYTMVLYHLYQIRSIFSKISQRINERVEDFHSQGSNLVLEHFTAIQLNVVQRTLNGGGTPHNIEGVIVDSDVNMMDNSSFLYEIPRVRKQQLLRRQKRFIVDCKSHIKNGCFLTAFCQGLLPLPSISEPFTAAELNVGGSRYNETMNKIRTEIVTRNLTFPVQIKQLKFFERSNSVHNINLNVFLLEKHGRQRELLPVYLSQNPIKESNRVINLLMVKSSGYLDHVDDESETSESDCDSEDDDRASVESGGTQGSDNGACEGEGENDGEESDGGSVKVVKMKGSGPKFSPQYRFANLRRNAACANNYQHYVFITHFDMFAASMRIIKSGQSYLTNVRHTCPNCLHSLSSALALENHRRRCFKNRPAKIVLPGPDNTHIKFDSFAKMIKQPVFGTVDFEATNRRYEHGGEDLTRQSAETAGSYTKKVAEQQPFCASICIVSSLGKLLEQRIFSATEGQELVRLFYTHLMEIWDIYYPKLNDCPDVPVLSRIEMARHHAATNCYLCGIEFDNDDPRLRKTLDHSHSSLDNAQVLGSCCNTCNINRRRQHKISLFCHNLKGYDQSFILSGLREVDIVRQMREANRMPSGLAENSQHFKVLNIFDFRFVDSFAFLSASLASLAKELPSDHDFPLMKQLQFKGLSLAQIDMSLCVAKSCFPYDYAESYSQLQSCKSFPPIEAFYSQLTCSTISQEEYEHGKRMFRLFQCESLLEYAEVYCLIDTMILLEILVNFREQIYRQYKLDCVHYISGPQLYWDVMLLISKAEIEHVADPEILHLVQEGLRGGLSYVSERFVDIEAESAQNIDSFLYFTDLVNLYGGVLSSHLPVGNYKWLSPDEIALIDWTKQSQDQSTGYIIECDLSYPKSLHEAHAEFPLAPEKYSPPFQEMSPFSQNAFCSVYGRSAATLDPTRAISGPKLCGTFHDKKYYALHYLNLQYYLRKGLVLTKIHRVLSFTQSAFLSDYISQASLDRKYAKSADMKSIIKTRINAIYGKMLALGLDYRNAVFICSKSLLQRYSSDSRFDSFRILGPTCCIFFTKDKSVKLDKPILCGFTVLEKSKLFMAHTYYERLVPALNKPPRVVMSDTDSFILHCFDTPKLEFMKRIQNISDFSNLPKSHPLYDTSNAGIPGFLKCETRGSDMTSVCALRSKQYHFKIKQVPYYIPGRLAEGVISPMAAKCKGLSKAYTHKLKMSDFTDCFKDNGTRVLSMETFHIRSQNFVISTQLKRSLALTAFCNKRFILSCSIHSVPYNSVHIEKYYDKCNICSK